MGLSVIIPSRNAGNLNVCASAVHRLDPQCDVIAVWDRSRGNHSLPPTDSYRVREVESDFIYARNCNLGIECAEENDVVLLNDDAILETPFGFSALQKLSEAHPEYGVISAATRVVGNVAQHPQGIGLREEKRMLCFVCVFIPRSTINKVGPLDERYTAYGYDDDDYSRRVLNAGLKLGVYDFCYVNHGSLPSTFRGDGFADLRQNRAIYLQKWGNLA